MLKQRCDWLHQLFECHHLAGMQLEELAEPGVHVSNRIASIGQRLRSAVGQEFGRERVGREGFLALGPVATAIPGVVVHRGPRGATADEAQRERAGKDSYWYSMSHDPPRSLLSTLTCGRSGFPPGSQQVLESRPSSAEEANQQSESSLSGTQRTKEPRVVADAGLFDSD